MKKLTANVICLLLFASLYAQKMHYTVSMEQPATHYFQVKLHCSALTQNSTDFKMPVWSPGYYQRLNYANNLQNFSVTDENGNAVAWNKADSNTWRINNGTIKTINITYVIKTTRMFVATPYVDEERAYIIPAGVFLHIAGKINIPVEITVRPYTAWVNVATGLDVVPGKPYTYTAPDFDVLYDSPLLVGNLEELPPFTVQGIPHRFIGYKLGEFDKVQLMADLKKIVEASVNTIGHIPYKHYTFIAIGPGAGGIEHLNNTTFSFSGAGLNNPQARLGMLHFIAHEYFHHYNVKRIRPIELGPFDYDKGSRTKQLWISEGLTVYYEYLVVKRAGISTEEQLLNALRANMLDYESKPGRLFQSLAQASYETWSDGPFGRTGDEVNRTISYYAKGPVAGMLFDFAIRHETNNKQSLDDVMRFLYREYYQQKKRGFTEDEFKAAVKKISGSALDELFEYVYTTKEIDYPKYLAYAGLTIDITPKQVTGGWLGISTRMRNDTAIVSNVEYESPAWNAGIRSGAIIQTMNEQSVTAQTIKSVLIGNKRGEIISITYLQRGQSNKSSLTLGSKTERSFTITRISNPSPLQAAIYKSWLGE